MQLLQETQKQYKDTDPDEKEKGSLSKVIRRLANAKPLRGQGVPNMLYS